MSKKLEGFMLTPSEIYHAVVRLVLRKSFRFWQRLGFHITPNHFYQPIPDTRMLKDELFEKKSEMGGIKINEKEQLELLSFFQQRFKNEYDMFPVNKTGVPYEYYLSCNNFISVDAEILYCMIRHFKPGKIIEIGSGYSTYLSAKAILQNKEEDSNYDCELIAIEPYPNKTLKQGFPGLTRLISKNVQDVPLAIFGNLTENCILFIDSSHVLKTGGDVQYEYLEILPRLNKGVIVHIHDIFLPSEYPKTWVLKDYRFWTEQYILQTFMAFNRGFEVLWAGS